MENNDTICRTCLRLREGLCDGEKELTACPSYKRMTNADRIRAMTDEEMAKWLCDMAVCQLCPIDNCPGTRDCETRWYDWLKQEVEG